MKILAVHPGGPMDTKIFLDLPAPRTPLGPEIVAGAARRAGHAVSLIDLQAETHDDAFRTVRYARPDAVCFTRSASPATVSRTFPRSSTSPRR